MLPPTITNSEGIPVHIQEWPVSGARAVIVQVHGQGEHIGRYAHLAAFYNQHQVAFLGYDQQGFGKSGGQRGHASGFEAYLNDLEQVLQEAASRYPNTPVVLRGHSMGGNVALNLLLRRRPDTLAAAIATGPWIRLAFEPPAIKIWLGRLLRNIFPKLTLPTGLDTSKICRDPEVVRAYNNDPLVHDKVSAAAGIDLMEAAEWLNTYTGDSPCPLLLQHAGADAITAAPATRELAQRMTGQVSYREWPDMFHEIHNEKDQALVMMFEWEWLEEQLNA